MAVRVGSARIDERGKATGGKAGDQTKGEVSTQAWYKHSKGWVVLRAKDDTVRSKIAEAMEAACANNHIGYDQSQRNTLYTAVQGKGFDPSKVTTDVETDCSALVRVCLAYAGIQVADFSTATEKSVIEKTGKFEVITAAGTCNSSTNLKRGDILVTKTKGHTVVVLDNGANVTVVAAPTPVANVAKTIWDFLKGKGLTECGIAGLMGNLKAESGLKPTNVQNSYEAKLGMNDETYTVAVDNGSYTNFEKDAAGYGLAQWTYHTRKAGLLKAAKAAGKSVGDLNVQLNYLWTELQGYKKVLAVLQTATTVRAASDAVLVDFEKPANQTEAVKVKRASYGEEYYKQFATGKQSVSAPAPAAGFKPYTVRVTASALNIRAGAGVEFNKVGCLGKGEIYTIVEEKMNGSTKWGKLKSGAGWISLAYTKRV